MKGARTKCLVLAVLLLLAAAVACAGCGDRAAAQENQVLSGLEPFVGQAALIASQDPAETVVGDVTQYRDGKLTLQVEASDPRVSGTAEVTFNVDERADGSATLWGTSVTTNEEGTWVCDKWTGAVSNGYIEQYVFCQCQGTGEYEGYTLYVLQHFYDTYETMSAPSASSAWTGWIEKTE